MEAATNISKDDFANSIENYETQLIQVQNALKESKCSEEQESLKGLEKDLRTLIDLITPKSENPETKIVSDNFDKEILEFQKEINKFESGNIEKSDDCQPVIQDEIETIVGKTYLAPYTTKNGIWGFHNAMVCSVEKILDDNFVRVFFINPIYKEMIPCSYFLDGECKFDAENCHFSHGELVPYNQLREYIEPNYMNLKKNSLVLVKMSDKLWHQAKVLCVNFMEKTCMVRLINQSIKKKFDFENLLLLSDDHENINEQNSDESSMDSDKSFTQEIPDELDITAQLSIVPSKSIGYWEKHTRGIGSKLMQKMGYIEGQGLGKYCEGRLDPIIANVLPTGRTLDFCMQLKEVANGDEDIFKYEKLVMIKKKKKTTTTGPLKNNPDTDIFSFLNKNLSAPKVSKDSTLKSVDYKKEPIKNLNVESVKVAESIKRKEKSVQNLKNAMKRHISGTDCYKKLGKQLAIQADELSKLRKSEVMIAEEQKTRNNKEKWMKF